MNLQVALLFANAILVTVLTVAAVMYILRREYLPAIRRAEQEAEEGPGGQQDGNQDSSTDGAGT